MSVTVWVCRKDPLVAVIVKVLVPAGVGFAVFTVRVEVAVAIATGFGLKLALERGGSPDTLSETEPVRPPEGVIVTVYVALSPRLTV